MRKLLLFSLATLFFAGQLLAQKTITGKVLDEKGDPLPNVSALVKGTKSGTTTSADGSFTIEVGANAKTLVFSSAGMTTIEVAIGTSNTMSVTLQTNVSELGEVVVTALGISRKTKSLGYAVGEIKGKDLTAGGGSNLVKSLDGRVSGVNFTQASTDPAGSVFITIRGATSLSLPNSTANSQPLYVIDGIPLGTTRITSNNGVDFGNLLGQLNPNDIESVVILKGAAAGALYGSQAGNGVILITTKSAAKGTKKGIGVSVNYSTVIDKPWNFFETQRIYGQGARSSFYIAGMGYDWGPKLDGSFNVARWNTLDQKNEIIPFLATNENRLQEFMQNGSTNNLNVSVTGNSDKGAFRLSLGQMGNIGVMPNNVTDRTTVNLNAEYNITKKIKISVNANYVGQFSPNKSAANNEVVNLLTSQFLAHLQPVKEMQNLWLKGFEGIRQNAPAFLGNGLPQADNPYMHVYGEISTHRKDNYFAKAELEWKISNPLKLLVRSGTDFNVDNYEYKLAKGSVDVGRREGRYSVQNTSSFFVNSDIMLNWNKDFKKFSTIATIGYNYIYSNSYGYNADAARLVRANDYSLVNAVAGTLTTSSGWGIGKIQSQYFTTQIGYDQQLFLDLSGRFDQGGILEEDKNSNSYPAAALSWIASETFKLPSYVNLIKLRGAIAQVGHGIGKPRATNTFSFNAIDYGVAKIVNIGGQLVDPAIQSELSTTYEAGFDVAFMNNRISADFTVFKKIHENQQDFIPTSPGIGYGGMLTNIGTVESKGIEIGLNLVPVRTTNWNWEISGFFTKTDAHITKLAKAYVPSGYTFYGNGPNVSIRMAEGDRIGTMWESRVYQRMPATSKYAGMFVLDNNGLHKFSTLEKDRRVLGNYNPDFILGMNSSVRYKSFRLSAVASLRQGGKYLSAVTRRSTTNGQSLLTIGDLVNGPNKYTVGGRDAASGGLPWPRWQDVKYPQMAAVVRASVNLGLAGPVPQDASYFQGVWLKPGGDPNNDNDYLVNGADPLATFYTIPGYVLGVQYWNFAESLIRDATNFKVKEIVLDYTIPATFTNRYKIQNLTVGIVVRNVWQWNKSGESFDPEAAFTGMGREQGIIGLALPLIRSYGFNVSVNF